MTLHLAGAAELADWDAHAVDAPGGHVLQSRAWADHRCRDGWQPRFFAAGGARVLALVRRWPLVGGGSAYVPRGPVTPADPGERAGVLAAVAGALAADGIDVVAADPEVPAAETPFREAIHAAGFRPIAEIQPSRHRITLPLANGLDEAAVFEAIAKSTRQRIRAAERAGLAVVRHDVRGTPGAPSPAFATPAEPAAATLRRFADLLETTGQRRGFRFAKDDFVSWWQAAHAAGHLVLLEARDGDEPVAGLLLYRHGGRLSTAHSADRAEVRRAHPGALHLLRWRAVQLALGEGCSELDLGGVDVPGARRPPREGEPMYGLYHHKLSFGGRWLELTGAHERVFRPRRYLAGRLAARAARAVPGGAPPAAEGPVASVRGGAT